MLKDFLLTQKYFGPRSHKTSPSNLPPPPPHQERDLQQAQKRDAQGDREDEEDEDDEDLPLNALLQKMQLRTVPGGNFF